MAATTIHVVQAFTEVDGEVAAQPPVSYPSAHAARAAALNLGRTHYGVVAWSRSADPEVGEYGEPVEIARLGTIPEWFDEGGGVEG